jgi:hypothetical protein
VDDNQRVRSFPRPKIQSVLMESAKRESDEHNYALLIAGNIRLEAQIG